MSAITVHCSHCNSPLKLKDRSRLGSKVKCPKCSRPFVLAESDDEWAGLESAGPASRSAPPLVRRSQKSSGGGKRGKASSGMSGAMLGVVITGVAVCLLLALGVGLWAAGVFSPDDPAVVAQNDESEAVRADASTPTPSEQETGTMINQPPVQNPPPDSTAEDETETQIAIGDPPEEPDTSEGQTPTETISVEEAERMVREAINSFVQAVATAEPSDAVEVMQSHLINEQTTKALFGAMGDDVWIATEELDAEMLAETPADQLAAMFNFLLSANAEFEVINLRNQADLPSLQTAVLAAMPQNALVFRSRMTVNQGGRQITDDFMDWVLVDGEFRAMRPLEDLAQNLNEHGKLVMPRRPLVALDESGRAFAGSEAGQTNDQNGINATFVWCPPGEFQMGTAESDVVPSINVEFEHPVQVRLQEGFWIGQTEVTQAQWKSMMESEPWSNSPTEEQGDEFPAFAITWSDAVEFCRTLTERETKAQRLPAGWVYALPTEAQWEYACRAGTDTLYPFEGSAPINVAEYGWVHTNQNPLGQAHAVALKKPNPWGIYDMHGNVIEWCHDWFATSLPGGDDPLGPLAGEVRVLRGGHYRAESGQCRSASRWPDYVVTGADHTYGFRVAIVRAMVDAETVAP